MKQNCEREMTEVQGRYNAGDDDLCDAQRNRLVRFQAGRRILVGHKDDTKSRIIYALIPRWWYYKSLLSEQSIKSERGEGHWLCH